MQTVNDLIREVANISSAANDLEVKGVRNAQLVVYIHEKANAILQMIDGISKQIQNGSPKEAADE